MCYMHTNPLVLCIVPKKYIYYVPELPEWHVQL